MSQGVVGTAQTYPKNNVIAFNHMHEIGIYGKQTSCYFSSLGQANRVEDNLCYNGPRAGCAHATVLLSIAKSDRYADLPFVGSILMMGLLGATRLLGTLSSIKFGRRAITDPTTRFVSLIFWGLLLWVLWLITVTNFSICSGIATRTSRIQG